MEHFVGAKLVDLYCLSYTPCVPYLRDPLAFCDAILIVDLTSK